MVNVYNEIVSEVDAAHANGFFEKLEEMDVLKLFQPILDFFKGELEAPLMAKRVIIYIAYCYSLDSPKISVNGDRAREKGDVFRALNIPHKDEKHEHQLYNWVVNLESAAVVYGINAWMERQGEQQFQYYITLKDSYAEMQRAALLPLTDKDGNINYDQKQRCIEHMTETKKLIKEAQAELLQKDEKLKVGFQEIKKAQERHKFVGPESFAKQGSNAVQGEQPQYH